MIRNEEAAISDSLPTASAQNSAADFRRCLERQAKRSAAFVAIALLCGGHASAQSAVPFAAKKPAGADKGVLLNLVQEKNLQMAPPAGAIYTFGSVDRFLHPILAHTFTLRNDGKVAVMIDHLQPSCGCTTALLLATGKETVGYKLLPGKQVGIKVAVDTNKLAPGPIKKFLWVMMPGETTPSYAIRMDATIEGVLTFTPPLVEFGRLDAGTAPTQMLTVRLDKRLIDSVGGVKLISSNPGVQITPPNPVDTPVQGGDGHTVLRTYTITVMPKASLGVLSGTLSFVPLQSAASANKGNVRSAAETATTFLSALTAGVTGEVFGKVSARPGTIAFGAVTQGDTTTRRLTLVGKTEAALHNLKVTSPSVWVTAKLSVPDLPKQDPNAVQKLPPMLVLEVTLNPKTPPGALQTQVVLTTEDGEQLVLPAFGYVTPSVKP